jgi:hypothetical protein
LFLAWLLHNYRHASPFAFIAGIVLGCLLTKAVSATVMYLNYAILGRRLAARLDCRGKVMGLAIGDEPRLYNGFRFADVGLLRFESGRLIYKSERTEIALNPADVVEVTMIAASPALWFRNQPMVRFRSPDSGEVKAFVLHPVDWLATQRRLLHAIQRWRATDASTGVSSIQGFDSAPGQPARNMATISGVARAFLVSGGVTLFAALLLLMANWEYIVYALLITACAHIFMFLPAMLYRPPAPRPDPKPAAVAG